MKTKNVLVLGGTRYFGKFLVELLLADNCRVTIATRGNVRDDFGDRVARKIVDRNQPSSMKQAFAASEFDVVFDQLCYTPNAARSALEVFGGKVGRYVMTSTIAVYNPDSFPPAERREFGPAALEQALDTRESAPHFNWEWSRPGFIDEHYGEGKRQAEGILFRAKYFPAVCVRVAHVMGGKDDYTGRLAGIVAKIERGEALFLPPHPGATSFISRGETAQFLAWAGNQTFTGAINACSTGSLSALDLAHSIGDVVSKTPQITFGADQGKQGSAFAYPFDLVMSNALAESRGFHFTTVDSWLKDAINEVKAGSIYTGINK